jgi:hypothetical protein
MGIDKNFFGCIFAASCLNPKVLINVGYNFLLSILLVCVSVYSQFSDLLNRNIAVHAASSTVGISVSTVFIGHT